MFFFDSIQFQAAVKRTAPFILILNIFDTKLNGSRERYFNEEKLLKKKLQGTA